MRIRVPVVALCLAVGLLIAGCDSSTDATQSPLATLPAAPSASVQELTLDSYNAADPPLDESGGLTVRQFPSGSAVLRGPHYGLGIAWVATGPGYSAQFDPLLRPFTGMRAADGDQLMMILIDPAFTGGQWKPSSGPNSPVAELILDGHAHVLTKAPLASPDLPMPQHGVLLTFSVRPNAPVELQVGDAGRTQTINVRTGMRAADAIPGYYRATEQQIKLDRPLPAGITVRGTPYPLSLGVSDATLTGTTPPALLAPWTPDQGWAAPGHAWLDLPGPQLGTDITVRGPIVTLTVDQPTAFHVRLPDGSLVPAAAGTRTMTSTDAVAHPNTPDLIFDMAAGFTTGTFVMDLSRAPIVAGFSDGDLPARWSPAPAAVEVPLNLNE
jgi:hypothetical protein